MARILPGRSAGTDGLRLAAQQRQRRLSYLIVGQIFDKYPNINAGVAEVGHGWLPHGVEIECIALAGKSPS
jgi:hypothetical protein